MSVGQTTGVAETANTPKVSPRVAWYSVAILALAYTFSYIDRSILSLMVGPIRQDLNISDTQFSLLHGLAFAIFYTLLGIPIARLADRKNRRNIIAIGVAFWSLMTALCGLAKTFTQLFLARVGVGIGEAALSPAAYSMIADLFPREKLGRALGVYASGVYIGIGLSFILGSVLLDAIEAYGDVSIPYIGTLYAWQVTFIIVGLPGLIVALLVYTLTEPVRTGSHTPKGVPLAEVFAYFKQHRKTYLTHFIGFSLLTLLYNGILAWTAEFFIRIHGMARLDIGPALGVITLVFGSAGIICGGLLSDYLERRGYRDAPLRAALVGALMLTPLGIVTPLATDPDIALLLFCPLMFAGSFPFGPATSALQIISPPNMRAQFSSLYLFCVNLTGIGLGATVTALVTDFILQDDMKLHYSMSIVSGVGGFLAIVVLFKAMAAYRKTVIVADTAYSASSGVSQ